MASPKGNFSSADYQAFLQDLIEPAVEEFKVADHLPLLQRLTYSHSVPLGQKTFKIPQIKNSSGIADRLGEYGRADNVRYEVGELEFTVERYGASILLTKDAIDTARAEGVLDPINRAVSNAMRVMDRTYANTLVDVVKLGWGGGLTTAEFEDAPEYAGRTFTAHTHVVDYRTANEPGNTPSVLTLDLILDAKDDVAEHGYIPDTIMMSPREHTKLIKVLDTNDAEALLEQGQIDGSIGRIFGMEIFVNAWMPDDLFLVVDSSAKPIVFAERESPEFVTDFSALNRLFDGQVLASWVFGVTEAWAGAVYYHDA